MGFVPMVARSASGNVVLRIPVPNAIFRFPRGMGQAYTSGPCQYQVPGITPDPGIPFCGPGGYQMTPAQIAAVELAQQQGGYSNTSEQGAYSGAFSSPGAAAVLGATYGGPSKAVILPAPTPAQPAPKAVASVPAVSTQTAAPPAVVIPSTSQAPVTTPVTSVVAPVSGTASSGVTVGAGASAGSVSSIFDATVFGFPIWMVGLVGLGAVWLLSSSGKR
jgi:hypothetical protein